MMFINQHCFKEKCALYEIKCYYDHQSREIYSYIYVDPEDSGLCLKKKDAFLNACTAASVIVGRSRFQ